MWLFPYIAGAQDNWVSYGQEYYKMSTAVDGIHRIPAATFSQAGLNLSTLDPRDIRVFHRSREIAVHVEGEMDGRLDPGDFLEFWGKRNDGTLDSLLYQNPGQMANPYYNTHSDTTAFFLTVTPGIRGKRMAVRNVPANPGAGISVYGSESMQVFSDQYNLGPTYNPGVRLSSYDQGQGWTGTIITLGNKRDFVFDNLGQLSNGGTYSIEIGLVGRSAVTHLTAISAGSGVGNQRELTRLEYNNFQARQVRADLAFSDFNPTGSITVSVSSIGGGGTNDNISVSYVKLHYTKNKVSGNFTKELLKLGPGENLLKLEDITENYTALDISAQDDPHKMEPIVDGSSLIFPVGRNGRQSVVFLQQESQVNVVMDMERLRFRNLLDQPSEYLMVAHRFLRRATTSYSDPVKAYADYRASPSGGGFDTLSVHIEELYDQFAYGEKSPLGLYSFLKQYYPRHQPDLLLLMGRSIGIFTIQRSGNVNFNYRKNPAIFPFQDLIPPFGYPYADNGYGEGLDPANPDSSPIGIGRIPARTAQELSNYLDKIIEKEDLGVSQPWQKNILHLSGGITALELERYYNFLNGFKTTAEGVYLGGNVQTIRKRSNTTIEEINVSTEVNNGTSLITFFGHASASVTDIEIGFASEDQLGYRNKGKYPVLLVNGCDSGNAFGGGLTFGEDWVMTPDRGASNFFAHAHVGVDVFLRRYSESFYANAFADSALIHQPIGKVKAESEKFFYRRYGNSSVNRSHAQQFVLLGDPAVRIFPADKADYSISEEEVFLEGFEGEPLNALLDSLNLKIVIRNLGRVDLDTVDLQVSRQIPDGTVFTYDLRKLSPIFRKDTISFAIPNAGISAAGENFFTIEVNKSREVDELTFANNMVMVNKFIQMSGTLNLAPLDYAIVHERELEIVTQMAGKSIEERNIVLQLDTAADFSSAYRKEIRIATPNLARWKVDVLENIGSQDTVTYYWRSRFLEPRENEINEWSTSSFTYISEGPEGWIQRQLPQLEQNNLNNLEALTSGPRSWKFQDVNLKVDVFTFGSQTEGFSFGQVQIYLNDIPYNLDLDQRRCFNGSLGIMTFDRKTLQPYLPVPLTNFDVLDEKSCGKTPQLIQNIRNVRITGAGQTMLLDYINMVKEGDYVVLFSVGNVTFQAWPDEVIQRMKELGASETALRTLQNGDPYILFGRKGMQEGEGTEVLADPNLEESTNGQILNFDTELAGFESIGSITTSRIGPASDWVRFYQGVQEVPDFNSAFSTFDIIGIRSNGEEVVLFEDVQEDEMDLSSINADSFPFVRLMYKLNDPDADEPEQLIKWQVNYTGVPEGVLLLKSKEEQFVLEEGQEIEIDFEFLNISRFDFPDSVTVEWTLNNTSSRMTETFSKKIEAPKAGDSILFSIPFTSLGRTGIFNLNVFANPRIFQEQTFRNNILDLQDYILVNQDDLNPILDVSFDGIYIMDGDIVSPVVMISALLKDENKVLFKKDTVGVEMYLKRPCDGCTFERISFSNPNLRWYPGSEDDDFKVEYQPGPLEDGLYTLRINATDASGNPAGEKPYEVNFEVVNESQITNFYPYPNPFSSSVRFVFTVTGSEVPDQIKIQIMTVTGKVVREIFQDELGPLRIGNNISEYAWDGKDEYGDQLANGVYIYRVLVRKNGQFMEHRATAGDKAFRKGYGKMYLLR
ncbi:putative type IX secretion system sortase PorU2 [Pararhodonellum marinum]|uniref:putative type IX secretion system sortase PorU2 n=1 Tax=Pararhodonellum marinum TaxID=2755358 RepID=UPI001E355C9F|nr:C25 family cysteine peptidase [Pararhodonellum marinum]